MLGEVLSQLGRFNEAIACCRRALVLDPDSAESYQLLVELESDSIDDQTVAELIRLLDSPDGS